MAHRSIDIIDGSLERGVYIQIRGVEQVRVGRHAERRHVTISVPFIAAFDVGDHVTLRDGDPGLLQLEVATPRSLLRGRCHKKLHFGIGADDGTDVASVDYGAGWRAGEFPLIGQEHAAHHGVPGDERGSLAETRSPQRGIVQRCRVEGLGTGKSGERVGRISTPCQGIASDGAVERAGVEIGET